MVTSTKPQPTIHLTAVCNGCRRKHDIAETPQRWLTAMDEWRAKHHGANCDIEFVSRRRDIPRGIDETAFVEANREPWWLEYTPNADLKLAMATSAAFTITLASLATSATLVAGRESTAIDNGTNLYLDYLIGGKVTTGTSPTDNKMIVVYAYGAVNDTPTFPDVFDGTDSDETVTSVAIRNASLSWLFSSDTDNTSDRAYWFSPTSLASRFGGIVPDQFGLFVTHDTAVNLNATGGNHALSHTGVYQTG